MQFSMDLVLSSETGSEKFQNADTERVDSSSNNKAK
jgi:hypothetical protein